MTQVVITRDDGFWRATLPDGTEDTSKTYAKLAERYPDHRLQLSLRKWPQVTRRMQYDRLEVFSAPRGTPIPDACTFDVGVAGATDAVNGWYPWSSRATVGGYDEPQILIRGHSGNPWPGHAWTKLRIWQFSQNHPVILDAPLPLDETDGSAVSQLDYTSPSVFVIVRPHDARWVASLGLGRYNLRVPGSYACLEDAQVVGHAAWRQHILEETDWIQRMRGGSLGWGKPLRPRLEPVVLHCAQGESGWEKYHEWRNSQDDPDVPEPEE